MVIFWSILIFIVVLLVFVLLLPAHLVFSAGDDDINVYLKILFLKKSLYPSGGIKKKKAKKKSGSKKPSVSSGHEEKKKKKSSDIISNVRLIASVLGVLIEKSSRLLRVSLYRLDISVGSDEAAKTAMLYGAACSACDMLLDTLSRVWNFKSKSGAVSVNADFLSEKTTGSVKIGIWTNIAGAIGIIVPSLLKYLKEKD